VATTTKIDDGSEEHAAAAGRFEHGDRWLGKSSGEIQVLPQQFVSMRYQMIGDHARCIERAAGATIGTCRVA
jgi:hypothetical protein